ncbi:ORF1 [Cerdocyon thous torque teno virus 1]|nr:ORF1 [Cerdocyon thous torque teno virus 1]
MYHVRRRSAGRRRYSSRRWWRRGLRSRYGRRRRGRRGYRRRWRVRKRWRRGRRYRKRAYITPVMQWMPPHRQFCSIAGYTWVITGTSDRTTWPSIKMQRSSGSTTPFWFTNLVGGAGLITFSLDFLYFENQRWRNRWSATNEGFDLARYFGTRLFLPPHADLFYIATLETEFEDSAKQSSVYAHPAIGLMTKGHKLIIPRKYGGRGKHMFARPPSVFNTQWFRMQSYCGAGLFRLYISLFNPYKGGIHTGQTVWPFKIGKVSNDQPPQQYYVYNMGSNEGTYYRWDWDTGEDNAIMLPKTAKPITNASWTLMQWDAPYWMWFFGKKYSDFTPIPQNLQTEGYGNVYLKWYDIKSPDDEGPHTDPKKKVWIAAQLGGGGPDLTKNGVTACLKIAQFGPYTTSSTDLDQKQSPYNIPLFYQSLWQWGGSIQGDVTHIKNPCTHPKPGTVYAVDPAHCYKHALHPWDLETSGHIHDEKFRMLLETLGYRAPLKQEPETGPLQPPEEGRKTPEIEFFSSGESDWPETSDDEEWDEGSTEHLLRAAARANKRAKHERKQRERLGNKLLGLLNQNQ